MRNLLAHILLPQESNNHKAKALHNKSFFLVIGIFFVLQIFLSFLSVNAQVLGTNTSITTQQLLEYTNKRRQDLGEQPLVLNQVLSNAANLKAQDMFAKNYWAHNSPDGDTPWTFFKKVGYEYQYAGENLARGFTSSKDVVDAWMESPSHRENIISNNYKDIGFAVEDGSLTGESTTLVVQMFGSTEIVSPQAQAAIPQSSFDESVKAESVSRFSLLPDMAIKNITLLVLGFFVFIFILDIIIIERRKIVRLAGHSHDHATFLVIIFLFIVLFSKASIL